MRMRAMQGTVPVMTSLPPEDLARLDEIARSKFLTRSAVMRLILLRELAKHQAPAAQATEEVPA
jgi:hypothetical protein